MRQVPKSYNEQTTRVIVHLYEPKHVGTLSEPVGIYLDYVPQLNDVLDVGFTGESRWVKVTGKLRAKNGRYVFEEPGFKVYKFLIEDVK